MLVSFDKDLDLKCMPKDCINMKLELAQVWVFYVLFILVYNAPFCWALWLASYIFNNRTKLEFNRMSKVPRTKYVSHIAIYFGVVYTLKWKTTTSWKYLRDDRYHRENNYGSVTKLVFMSDGHFDTLRSYQNCLNTCWWLYFDS